jgi:hypothetical protein
MYTFPQLSRRGDSIGVEGCGVNARLFDTKLTACFVNTEFAPFPPVSYMVSRLLADLPWGGWVWAATIAL